MVKKIRKPAKTCNSNSSNYFGKVTTLYNACSVHWGMFSTSGDTMSTSGDIMSGSGDVKYIGGIS